ncbi:metal ABC transporter substrate-binding protein [Orientia tsutsugamushi]|uniref:Zinc/manganese ABC transporter substrate binding protein n=1 Tax=Orientia tsutsugamushi (strain Boryong) TaxID=357244 RepID=A5CCR5_ORITB|nr:zinc ABC transporter substrate-binding protein [Orientia tsutsugamushi]CAM79507.1 zinc/manganese ABC transporter substrate binding protein [Orientia tsutsugamushi str. Boryong]
MICFNLKLFRISVVVFFVFNYCSINIVLAQKKLQIVTSNTPIAAIVKAIVKDLAKVESLEFGQTGCSHGYQLRPGDIYKVQSADLIIYIDDRFEHYMTKLSSFFQSQVIRLSEIEGINLIRNGASNNWHVWYDINNIKLISLELYNLFEKKFDSYARRVLFENYQKLIIQLNIIQEKQIDLFKILSTDIIVLDSAIEYFFYCNKAKVIKVPTNCHGAVTLSAMQQIKSLSKERSLCLILGQRHEITHLSALFNNKIKVVRLNSEMWPTKEGIDDELILSKLYDIIAKLHDCL